MNIRQTALLGTVLFFLVSFLGVLNAQTATGTITGTVKDSSGATVAHAKVIVASPQIGLTRDTVTSDSGDYSFTLLPVGVYAVTAEQPGFQTSKQENINLNVDQTVRIDLNLSVGSTSETVTVQASTVAVETETSSIGQVVGERQVSQLPLNGRNFTQLLFLGAGAVETSGEQGSMRKGEGDAISINGARPTSNNYLLDGMANTDTSLNTPAVVLSVDAIQEFKEQTATYSAEYGFSANQINIVSKGGTNELHGALFEFNRNSFLDARQFFNAGIPFLNQNQFGFVANGPVYIPKIYNGHNRTFWMANYEGSRIRTGSDYLTRVPTASDLSGTFSTPILDPLTGQNFPNNTIPQDRYSNLAKVALAKFFPAPNIATTASGQNFRVSSPAPIDGNQQTYRIDQNLGRFGTVFARGTVSDYTSSSTNNASGAISNTYFVENTTNWAVSHTLTIGPTMVNQFRFGYLEATANQVGYPANTADISALGLGNVFTALSPGQRVYPSVGFQQGGYTGVGGAVNAYQASNQPMWDFADSFTWVRGNHTIGLGAEYRSWKLNRDLADNFLGNFTFNGVVTGNQFADFLLGYYSEAAVFQPSAFSASGVSGNPRTFNLKYFAPYIQDDWKVNAKLTLNLGVRWDFRTVPYETRDHMGWLDVTNPRGGLCMADKTLLKSGVDGDQSYYRYCGRRNPADASLTPFAPRVGFAYRPFGGDRTVVRGGYGIFWDSSELRETDGSADLYPYVSRGDYKQTLGQPTPFITTNSLFPPIPPGVATPAANTFIAVIASEAPHNPYVQQWTLSVQRQLSSSTTLEVNYIGNKGTHLLMRQNIAQAYAPDPNNITPVAARKPYANFQTYINSNWGGNSNYNAMDVKVEHRSGALAMTGVYTWAKSLDIKSAAAGIGNAATGWQGAINNHNLKQDHGRSDFDVDHRVVASFVYELPFGHGKRFLGGTPKVVDTLLGNWQLNGIATFQRGFPYSIYASDIGGLLDAVGNNRANIVGNPYPSGFNKSINQWFNTAAFQQPAAGVFGTIGRNTMRGPGINNFDLSLFKNFPIKERVNLQLRFESFNAFNHTQWGTPHYNVSDAAFGQITGTRAARINQLGGKFTW